MTKNITEMVKLTPNRNFSKRFQCLSIVLSPLQNDVWPLPGDGVLCTTRRCKTNCEQDSSECSGPATTLQPCLVLMTRALRAFSSSHVPSETLGHGSMARFQHHLRPAVQFLVHGSCCPSPGTQLASLQFEVCDDGGVITSRCNRLFIRILAVGDPPPARLHDVVVALLDLLLLWRTRLVGHGERVSRGLFPPTSE